MAAASGQSWCFAKYDPPPTQVTTDYKPILLQSNGNSIVLFDYANDSGANYAWQSFSNYVYTYGLGGGNWFENVNNPPHTGFHVQCYVFGKSSNSTIDAFFTDGVQNSIYTYPGGGHLADVWSGSTYMGQNNGGYGHPSTFYYMAVWPTQLTTAQVQQATWAMRSAVMNRGVQIQPQSSPASGIPAIIAEGDSITNGGGSPTTTEWWPSLLSVNAAYGTPNNEGLGGYAAWALASFAPWKDAPQCVTGANPSAAIFFAGTNDVFAFGFSAASAYSNIMSWVNQMRGSGCQLFVGTMISRASSTGDAEKDVLNPLIRSGAASGLYNLIDFASDPHMGCDGCYASGTYFNSDLTHPLNAGQVLLGAEASNAINAYGIGAASSANPTVYASNAVTMVSADRFATIIPTAAATATLPDCLGVTGTVYQISNASAGAFTITFSGKTSEAITGSTTLAQNLVAKFQATLISQAAAGCGWLRVQ